MKADIKPNKAMCKFTTPTIPADATTDEKRAIMFNSLNSLDLSDKCEKRENLTYLSWANAWAEFKSAYPSATYSIWKNPQTGLPYATDPETGIIVFTEVTVDGITHEMWLPVMDSKNKAMKLEPYTYSAWDNYKKQYIDKTVQAATMFDINKTIMRCLVKNLAMFGLGLYIYAGEDLPETAVASTASASAPAPRQTTQPFQPTPRKTAIPSDPTATLKASINATADVASLVSLYLDNTALIEGNAELKALLTDRKKALQTLNS